MFRPVVSWFQRRRASGAPKRALLKYHGVWGPGVRLLQNQRFRNKALLMVLGLILPMGYLIAQEWQRHRLALDNSRRAMVAMSLYRQVSGEMAAVGELGLALYGSEQYDAVPGVVANFTAQEQLAYTALDAAMAAPGALPGNGMHQMLAVSRARAEARKLLQAAPVEDNAPGLERYEALAALEYQLDLMRLDVLHVLDAAAADDEMLKSLIAGGLEHLPNLLSQLRQANQAGSRVYVARGRHRFSLGLIERAVTLQSQVESAARDLQPALALGAVNAEAAHQSLSAMADFAAVARRIAQTSITAAGEHDLIAVSGLDQQAYRERASELEASGKALFAVVVQATQSGLDAQDARRRARITKSLGLTGGGVLLMVYLLVCMNKVVGGGLKELCARVDALAQGDLSEKPEARGSDEVGTALTALADSIRRMNSLFEAVTQGVAAVSHASREVAVGNAGLSGRTGDIRRSIGDVGERARASMDAMNRCGDEVERIAAHMRDVRIDAQRSRKAMGELQTRMLSLQTKSREIGRVVLLVEAVAHQTRLLSLNASVEAARAGAAGKGFGVVAQEVRDLAKRSEVAAQKIADIVQASVNDIDEGGMLSTRVSDSVRLTDERVAEVSAIMGDIVRLTHTGRDQSQEVVGITRNVEESAGGNARMVEQLAHASADLREQGDNLKRSMQHFVFG